MLMGQLTSWRLVLELCLIFGFDFSLTNHIGKMKSHLVPHTAEGIIVPAHGQARVTSIIGCNFQLREWRFHLFLGLGN